MSNRRRAAAPGTGASVAREVVADRGLRAALRRPEAPELGMRFAYSYLVAVVATLVAFPIAFALVGTLYRRGAICPDDAAIGCAVLSFGAVFAGVLGALLAVGAWFFRLGWRWWLAGAGTVLLLVELVVDPFSPWFVLALAVPALAAVLSAPEIGLRGLRTALVAAVGAVATGWLLWAVLGA